MVNIVKSGFNRSRNIVVQNDLVQLDEVQMLEFSYQEMRL